MSKSKKYIKRGGYQKKLKKTRRSSRGGVGTLGRPSRPVSARVRGAATELSKSLHETFNRTKKNREKKVKTLVESLDVVKVEDGDDEVCHRLKAQVEGLNILCGKLIKELHDKNMGELHDKNMGMCNITDTQNVKTSKEQEEKEKQEEEQEDITLITDIREAESNGEVIEEVTQDSLDDEKLKKLTQDSLDDEKLKKLKEKIMRTIVNAISSSESITREQLNSFINDDNTDENALNKDKITEYLSHLAKTKVNGMVYNIISKKIASKATNACASFEKFFNHDEKKTLIATIRKEITEKVQENKTSEEVHNID